MRDAGPRAYVPDAMSAAPLDTDSPELLAALKRGDEEAFVALVQEHSSALLRVAMIYVGSRAVAEEVVQETWIGVLKGLDRFAGRASLKTWIFKILTNIAATRGARERRSAPFSSLAAADGGVVDADRFFPPDHDRWPGHWALGPTRWETPEEGLMSGETRRVIMRAIEQLPSAQRTVITLRDIEGWPSNEICDALSISEGNQRVLLHRARSKVRTALERHFDAVELTVT
jgi:RNA polymerase sigma-70 factor (ECF subfamily)